MASNTLSRLQAHLQALQDAPTSTVIDKRLLDEAELVLPDTLAPHDLHSLILSLSSALQTTREDATPIAALLQKLLTPFTFADVLTFDPPIDFVSGLTAAEQMVSINKLMLNLLEKAVQPADVATIASWPGVVRAFIHLWLSTSDSGIASQAATLIVNLLRIDRATEHADGTSLTPGSGQGLMWKRLFSDRDVYGTLYSDCDLETATSGKRQATLAQARLLEVLPEIAALDWTALTGSHHVDIEAAHGVEEGGLLAFAALKMVDYKDDVLTYWVLINFYKELLVKTKHIASGKDSSIGLEFLLANGIHERVAGIYLNNADGFEAIYLYGPAADYLGTYATLHSQHYMASPLPGAVHARLMSALNQSASRYTHGEAKEHDLRLLACLPRKSLLPNGDGSAQWSMSPVSLLPSSASNPAVLDTLATIFSGPARDVLTFPLTSLAMDDSQKSKEEEAASARALYFHYVANNQKLWKDIAAHADTIALVDAALAAIRLLTMVITANWSTTPELVLPTSVIAAPETGPLAILSPPALEFALPYLMKPPKTFSNLVGGRGDTESATYKIATAKYDALQLLHSRLEEHLQSTPDSGLEDVIGALAKRLGEGPFSRAGEVGGRIATVEL